MTRAAATLYVSKYLGIKRLQFRKDDAKHAKADTEYKSKRPRILKEQEYKCPGCGYVCMNGSSLEIHHYDDNHRNNEDSNLIAVCHQCHAYQHVGHTARANDNIGGEGLGKKTLVASIPEISVKDLNLLQRAIGVALNDEEEAATALKIMECLAKRTTWVKAEFGTFKPGDFAAAMSKLTDDEYGTRGEYINDLRVLFNKETNKKIFGKQMIDDFPSLPIKVWEDVSSGEKNKIK